MSNPTVFSRRELIAGGAALATIAGARPAAASAPAPALRKDLEGLARLVGQWRGEGEGEPGTSQVERTYESTLGGQFLTVRNTSTYAPQTKNPSGEVHNDVGFYSFDKARQRAVFRQFHTEGFVNQYVASVTALDGAQLVFESEAIENIPAGWRARETYRFSGANSFEEIFELAEPGKDFTLYSHARLRRV